MLWRNACSALRPFSTKTAEAAPLEKRRVEFWTDVTRDAESMVSFLNSERDRRVGDMRATLALVLSVVALMVTIGRWLFG